MNGCPGTGTKKRQFWLNPDLKRAGAVDTELFGSFDSRRREVLGLLTHRQKNHWELFILHERSKTIKFLVFQEGKRKGRCANSVWNCTASTAQPLFLWNKQDLGSDSAQSPLAPLSSPALPSQCQLLLSPGKGAAASLSLNTGARPSPAPQIRV